MKRLYLHIGMAKTATSAIQSAFVENEELLTENGCLYPKAGRFVDGSHHVLAFTINPSVHYSEFCNEFVLEELRDEIENTPHNSVILSSECFIGLQYCQEFLDIFKDYEIHIFACIREPSGFIESWYRQWVKDPHVRLTDDFDSFFEKQKSNISIDKDIEDWLPIVSPNNIHLLNFDCRHHRENIVTLAFRTCGIEGNIKLSHKLVNQSLSYNATRIMLELNRSNISKEERSKLLGLLLSIKEEQRSFLNDRQQQELSDIYSSRYQRMFESYLL